MRSETTVIRPTAVAAMLLAVAMTALMIVATSGCATTQGPTRTARHEVLDRTLFHWLHPTEAPHPRNLNRNPNAAVLLLDRNVPEGYSPTLPRHYDVQMLHPLQEKPTDEALAELALGSWGVVRIDDLEVRGDRAHVELSQIMAGSGRQIGATYELIRTDAGWQPTAEKVWQD